MHHRRSQGDSKSINTTNGSLFSVSTTNNASIPSTTGRVSIYSMRERVILNKMTRIMEKLAPDTETEVTSRLHQEIPAIKLDGHLTYCLYITLQNLAHFNCIYILLYHTVFWLDCKNLHREIFQSSQLLEQTNSEETHFLTITYDYNSELKTTINIDLINKYIYISLLIICILELINTFLWTIKKKLPYLIQRNEKLKNFLNKFLIGIIISIYLGFISWILFHTFITYQLNLIICLVILSHLIILTLLDKPNLFKKLPNNISKQSINSRKQNRTSTSPSSSTYSIVINALNRLSYRSSSSSSSIQPRKIQSIINSSILLSWSQWSSVTEEKLPIHICSTFYQQIRQEANDLWFNFIRRIILNFYRTFSSFILFVLIPIQTMDTDVRSIDTQSIKFLILVFILSTFVTHSTFLFPIKLQTTLHRIATHLGQWRQQSNIRTDIINEWSSECNSYLRGSVVKFSSINQYFIAIQHLNNAANPLSKSHSILYKLFGDQTYFLTIQFILSIILVLFHIIWLFSSKYWEEMLIGYLIIISSLYPIFKIVRNRMIMDLTEEHEFSQISTISKQKKAS